jgi:hypothetical protein
MQDFVILRWVRKLCEQGERPLELFFAVSELIGGHLCAQECHTFAVHFGQFAFKNIGGIFV